MRPTVMPVSRSATGFPDHGCATDGSVRRSGDGGRKQVGGGESGKSGRGTWLIASPRRREEGGCTRRGGHGGCRQGGRRRHCKRDGRQTGELARQTVLAGIALLRVAGSLAARIHLHFLGAEARADRHNLVATNGGNRPQRGGQDRVAHCEHQRDPEHAGDKCATDSGAQMCGARWHWMFSSIGGRPYANDFAC